MNPPKTKGIVTFYSQDNKRHMKKRMVALLCAGLVAASLAGCSGKKADAPAEPKATEAAGSEAAGSEAATEAAKANTDFPKKNIKIIVPYDAGGGVDITTRILAEAAGKDYFNGPLPDR